MNVTLFCLALVCLVSCTDSEIENRKPSREPVRIVVLDVAAIPNGTATDIVLTLKAVADNGCWSDLAISMVPESGNHFLLRADGWTSHGTVCPAVLVYKDTVMTLSAVAAGEYYFRANLPPFTVLRDTITIE